MLRPLTRTLLAEMVAVGWLFGYPVTARATEPTYPSLGQVYSHSMLTSAFSRMVTLYVVDPMSQECRPARQLRAVPIRSEVERLAGNRLWLKSVNGPRIAIIGYRGALPTAGQPIKLMAMPTTPATVSTRDKDRQVISVRQYRDVTMTFDEFVGFLRNGYHFPEQPELMTEPGRRRLFSTERTRGNKVKENDGKGESDVSTKPPQSSRGTDTSP